jgi:ribonuclease P/MRP protein subunit POP3
LCITKEDPLSLTTLLSTLSPIGQHRASHIARSKGKRDRKRKRQEARLGKHALVDAVPPPPGIASFIVVGLKAITRSLETLSSKAKPNAVHALGATDISLGDSSEGREGLAIEPEAPPDNKQLPLVDAHFSAIFVLGTSQPPILRSHLPQLIATASLAHPNSPAIRLILLPNGSEARLCAALALPRVSFIGLLEGAPYSKAFTDLFRDIVPAIEVPWLQEMNVSKYRPVKINAINTFCPESKKNQT